MSDIQRNLQKILSAVWGKDVRQAIHDSIHDCYEDGKAGVLDLIARQNIEVLRTTKADKTELAVERARIDEMTSLPEGSTTGDAELADGRIGYDGTTYQNIGKAIRTQVKDLHDDLDVSNTDINTNKSNITNLQNDVTEIKSDLVELSDAVSHSGFPDQAKNALLACFEGVAWLSPNSEALIKNLKDSLAPEWGSDYTWLYRPSEDGLLSEYENVSSVVAIGSGLGVETLRDGILNVTVPYDGNNSQNSGNIYKLSPLTCTNAVLKAKVKFNSLSGSPFASGLRLQLSNGSKGSQMFAFKHSDGGDYRISTHREGDQLKLANIELGKWYILSCEIKPNNTQVLKINDTVYDIDALSSYANTESRIIFQQANRDGIGGDVDVDIAWVSFKNNA